MFSTFLGHLVGQVEPTSEADPVNILASLLATTGVHLGSGPHIRAGDDRHPLLVWPMVIGRTGIGRKGAGWSAAKRLLHGADPWFLASHVHSGLTSGEGLAQMFAADDTESTDDAAEDSAGKAKRRGGLLPPGDRRLLAFEPEWASVMARMRRDGNTLSATLRAAWEGGDLSTLGVNARIVRDTHIGILTHITPGEFRSKLSGSDLAGGTYNRFLPVLVAQTRFLPGGTGADPHLLTRLGADLGTRLETGGQLRGLDLTDQAAYLWRRLYVEFGGYTTDDGPVVQFLSRAAPNCLRIAGIHAALDGSHLITPTHLEAAAAFIRYAVDSARAIFGSSAADRLADWIAQAGEQGRSREEVRAKFFRGNADKDTITGHLNDLVDAGRIACTKLPRADGKPGRGKEVYIATHTTET
ncbi:DUF3987 domain-containing protein [Saccharopolyspora sp. 6V]|uniref:DUF3987 domain-containing protein n=1 Tax=Saccharopolyspora sp. 6V TaxID=2877239 RepID=UPI001CD1E3E6|nr:DUF3987 domain-containing protein [Saccharopolyspora sp. 6V]MCA1194433.1 DUF3987 domain-containing protein [Saccharopolyspora sp. 6V]